MFVSNLNEVQQEALLSLSKKLIRVDGIIDEREENLLEVLRAQCRVVANGSREFSNSELMAIFSRKGEKVSFLLELIGVAHADEVYGIEEKDFVREISRKLNISEALQMDMENWVKKQLSLVKEASNLMEE